MRCGVIAPASRLRQAGPSLEEGIVRLFDILPFLDRRGQGWLTDAGFSIRKDGIPVANHSIIKNSNILYCFALNVWYINLFSLITYGE